MQEKESKKFMKKFRNDNFYNLYLHQDNKIEKNHMGGACSTYFREEDSIFEGMKPCRRQKGRMILLKWNLIKL
jgi:hypothetical protein